MPALSVRLFGQLSLCYEDKALEDFIPGKAKELFCYLLTHRQRAITRESLATILWQDCTTEHSKQYLRKALWQLQRGLGKFAQSAEVILHVDSEWVSLNSKAEIWFDVEEFERICAPAQNSSWWIHNCRPAELRASLNLYRGDLMEGWYEDWCLYERERLQNIYLDVLNRFLVHCEAHGEYEEGMDYGARILRCDRAHEVAHQHLMRILYLAGDRAGALRQYERCAAALKEELAVQPSERTRELYGQIREDHLPAITSGATRQAMESNDQSHLHRALGRLQELKVALARLQDSVEHTLLEVTEALTSPTPKRPTSHENHS